MTNSRALRTILLVAAPTAALLVAGSWFQPSVAGSDLWWHLASGREIWASGSVPHVDSFSYTFAGRPWTNHEWLWDVIYWGIWRIHPEAVAWFQLGLVFAVFGLAYANARSASGSALAAGISIALAAACSHWFLDIRPHVWTLLFVGVLILTRDRAWAPWLWPALMLIWVNLHSGFVFGMGVIGLIALFHTGERSLAARKLSIPVPEWIAVGACFAVMGLNPYGYSILEYPIAYLNRDSPFRWIIEWLPTPFVIDPRWFGGRFWWMVLLVAGGFWFALRRDPFLAALATVTFAMAWTSRRFIPLFAVTAAPVAALGLAAIQRELQRRWRALDTPAAAAAVTVGALLLAAVLWRDVRLHPRLLDRWTEHWFYPQAALRYLQALGPPERILNYYNWGGYMFLHAPGVRAFIDGRANTLYDDRIYLDYLTLMRAGRGHRALLARYDIELVFFPVESALVRALTSGPDRWTLLYWDRAAAILVPPGSPLLRKPGPDAIELANGHPDIEIPLSMQAARKGDADAAIARLEAVIERDPLIPDAYGELAGIYARSGDFAAAREVIERGLEAFPREAQRLHALEAHAYGSVGATDRTIEALRKAIPRGPFSDPSPMQRRLRQVEAKRGR
jgi:tetratricopeptide (TPR) repeat protein